ncbi:MAG: 50S ribosomal protein L25 [Syntrophobacterales bacterium]|nr:50S ribosomal protein L25 [Syntrophobacterales bacterium]HNQ02822.1 50S ribosomal protein L25 [Syntrophales bacterium]
MEALELQASIRTESGKGPARRLRAEGLVPAVLYGSGAESILLTVNAADLIRIIRAEKGETGFIKLVIDEGGKKAERVSVIKELQTNTVTKKIVHADFYEIRMDRKLTRDVPIHIVGDAIGVEKGGELKQFKRDVKISCVPGLMPRHVDVDVTNLAIGDTIRVGDLRLAEGIEILDTDSVSIVTVAAKRGAVTEEAAPAEEAEEAAKEPELVGKKGAKEEE